ncbi:MAG: UDP-glucose/GDP-mannose dehydrogenase family protein [Chrysiogenetes bacterium]|nr:UDP-glucose/GDP-mannose dehydrogenase family protein [Chrysiogenetes bacterium]
MESSTARISIIGCGYVGLVTGACFADAGYRVRCYDIDQARVGQLKAGELPIYEPGLAELVSRNLSQEGLTFTGDLSHALDGAQFVFLCLPTPQGENGETDLRALEIGVSRIAPLLPRDAIVITKSTVPVGQGDAIEAQLRKARPDWEGEIVSNPEFLTEGTAVTDFQKPSRVVIGATGAAADAVAGLYEPFVRTGSPTIKVSRRSAELAKYAANYALATRISMMNELAALSEALGANIDDVRRIVGADSRIGPRYLFAGAGFGGSCLPKDLASLRLQAGTLSLPVVDAVLEVNESQRERIARKLRTLLDRPLKDARVALWGLSFKPETDDVREAPAIYLAKYLLKQGARVVAFDPKVNSLGKAGLQNGLEFAAGPYAACEGAHALAVMTEWNLFRKPDFARVREVMSNPAVLDARNLYEPAAMRELGFAYECIGARG